MKKYLTIFTWAIMVATFFASCASTNADVSSPKELVVSEGFKNPIGFYDAQPTFSWKLPAQEQVKAQTAYRIAVASSPDLLPLKADLWETGKITSDQSVWVVYQGKPLESRQKVYWQVMFWDQEGNPSAWSETAHFEMGLLNNSDWQAQWINLEAEQNPDKDKLGTLMFKPEYLRKEFNVSSDVKQARLYITSKGVFEAQLNGEKVGQDVMTPGFTPYAKRIETLTYDVTEQLKTGENAFGIILGEGWYSGRLGWNESMWAPKPLPQAIAQLEIIYNNGEKETILTGSDWKGSRMGPIRYSGIYDGEIYDANMEMPEWSKVNYDDETWTNVIALSDDRTIQIAPKRHSAATTKEQLSVKAITEPAKGAFVFDMGQNMVGVPKLQIPVKKNQKVTIRYAEMLQKDGSLYTESYRSAKSTDYYIPQEDGTITWQPTFTFHGFRYVELSGFDESATPDKNWVTGLVQHSDFDKAGSFSSSHDKLNLLQSNIVWGMRSNFLDIPTDCPQRDERLGWTGDAQVFAPTSMFNGDVHAFWAAWLQSMREDQDDEGGIPFVVPNIMGKTFSSGWADAATVIPWEIYFRTGNIGILEENYDMMRKLVGYYQSKSTDNIVDVNTFGDWLQPNPEGGNQRGDTPKELIGTAYFGKSITMTLKAAEVLGKDDDVAELKALFSAVSTAFEKKFFDQDGKLTSPYPSQTGYLMALDFNLISDSMKQAVLDNLLLEIEKADNHLRTGFLGTPLLAPVLDAYGHSDLMYSILFKETYPSWFFPINQGATTMWERWNSYSHADGFGDAGMNSFNHYAYGAIGQWMYERIAGLKPLEAGYKKILIDPLPGGPLTSAKAQYESIYGSISSEWEKTGDEFKLQIAIPANTTASVVLPNAKGASVTMNGEALKDAETNSKEVANNIQIEVGPGNYTFSYSGQ